MSELSNQSQKFGQRLREAVEIALEQGDEDLLTVDVARLFLDKDTEEMMDAFRRYCVRSVSHSESFNVNFYKWKKKFQDNFKSWL